MARTYQPNTGSENVKLHGTEVNKDVAILIKINSDNYWEYTECLNNGYSLLIYKLGCTIKSCFGY